MSKALKKPVKVTRLSDADPKVIEVEKRQVSTYLAKGYKLVSSKTTESKAVVKKPIETSKKTS